MTAFPRAVSNKLADDLARRLNGEVRFDDGARALYATDGSNYRMPPIGVVIPKTIEDVMDTLTLARRHNAPVLSRGGGTSLAGQCCNTAVIIDFSKYLNHVVEIDADGRRAWVEPGCILDVLRDAAEKHHLTFGPDPSTHSRNTLGGMIGNNSCGVHSIMAGRTSENVEQLEVLTYDGLRMWVGPTSEAELERLIGEGGRKGDIYRRLKSLRDRYGNLIRARYPQIPRRVSGYNLDQLLPEHGFHVARALVGSEGTCVTILQAALRLVPSPGNRILLVLGYPDVFQAADHVVEIRDSGCIGLEGFDDVLITDMKKMHLHPEDLEILPEGKGFLMAEYGGDSREASVAQARSTMESLAGRPNAPSMKILDDPAEVKRMWLVREAALAATAHIPGKADAWEGWEDSAVDPAQLGDYLRDFRALLDRYDYETTLYGHFGDGCVHCRINFDLQSKPGIRKWRRFLDEAADLVLRHNGSFSGEHGDGQSRAELLPKMFGPELIEAFREFKAIWDPNNRMNPGKVVDPNPITADLRLGPSYPPREPNTVFAYGRDDGKFSRAMIRCVGVGACRHVGHNGDVMCPSFLATREEAHCTRGRARLLFEMVHGGIITDGWKSEAVREALDLCLACKGCKRDCPVGVDMASYKAEFFSHYYKGRVRPRPAYSMGLIHWWARAAALAPRLINAAANTPSLAQLIKSAAGIARARQLPSFAPQTFRQRFRQRPAGKSGPAVVLWPDTFNNHFHPEVGLAAVDLLEAAGYRVVVPDGPLCCARPLFAWGMLDLAKRQLKAAIDKVLPEIDKGAAMVVLEPACLASFRDELLELFPNDQGAKRVAAGARLLSEFLIDDVRWTPPKLPGRALVHLHCNHHALFGDKSERAMLDALGLEYRMLEAGCCGMAGSFGFEADHYEVSMAAGEFAFLPAVRAAAADTLLITNGYSCREQIAQCTGRQSVHLAEVAAQALSLGKTH